MTDRIPGDQPTEPIEPADPVADAAVADLTTEPGLDALVAEVERRCPLYNLFRDAGVTPAIRWSLNV